MPAIKLFPKTRVASVTELGLFKQTVPSGFAKLFAWLGANNLQPVGASFGIFHDDPAKVAPEKLRSELCVPVAPDVQGSGDVQVKEIEEFQAATIVYQGEANITAAYNKVYDWLRAQGYRDTGAVFEVYLSMPGEELSAEVYVPIVKVTKPVEQAAKKMMKKPAKKIARQTPKNKPMKK